MLDGLSKLGQLAIPSVGLLIAFSVYRLNSEKLFLDMVTARREAVDEVLDAAQSRQSEAQGVNLIALMSASISLSEQGRFWRAVAAAKGLFGKEVGAKLDLLDDAIGTFAIAVFAMRQDAGLGNFAQLDAAYTDATEQVNKARQALVEVVLPYINLGRRGLPLMTRIRLGWR